MSDETAAPPDEAGDAAPENGAGGADHLDGFRAPELDPLEDDAGDVRPVDEHGEPLEDPAQPMDKESFWIVFRTAFDLPGYMVTAFRPLGIQEDEEHRARAASDAVYDLLAIYYPRALMPMGDTVALLLAAAPFFIGKAMIVREILADARKPKGKPAAQDAGEKPKKEAAGTASPMSWMDQEAA